MSPPARSVVWAIGFVLLSTLIFGPLVQTGNKLLALAFPIVQLIWVRSVGHMVWMLILFWPKNGWAMFKTRHPAIQLGRSALLLLSSIFWISGIPEVPLALAGVIGFTAPIMVVVLSIPLLGERVGPHRWGAVVGGFIGALVALRPGTAGISLDIWLLFGASLAFALYQILTRMLSDQENRATTQTYTVIIQLVATSLILPFVFKLPEATDTSAWIAFAAIGIFGGFRHFFVVKALDHAPASFVSPFFYTELIGVTLMGLLVFGNFPDVGTWVGAAIIMASGLYITHREAVSVRRQDATAANRRGTSE